MKKSDSWSCFAVINKQIPKVIINWSFCIIFWQAKYTLFKCSLEPKSVNNYIFLDKKVTCNCLNLTVVNIALIIVNVNSVNSKIKNEKKDK